MNHTPIVSHQPDIALAVHALTKTYGKIQALRGIDLEVRRGEIFGFLGPNGAGKTTTIRRPAPHRLSAWRGAVL